MRGKAQDVRVKGGFARMPSCRSFVRVRSRRLGRLAPVALAGLFVLILATPSGAATKVLTGKGTVEGDLKADSLLTVKLDIQHQQGWQHLTEIEVDLELQGRTLEELIYDPTQGGLNIVGGSPSVSLGEKSTLEGTYFEVNAARVTLSAQGNRFRLTVPIRLRIDPPPGARLVFNAKALPLDQLGVRPLTPPVEENTGFSWGTLGLAIAVALFAGGFMGNIFSTRRRVPVRPSVYSAVSRQIDKKKEPASK
jgi:hypothetical protein